MYSAEIPIHINAKHFFFFSIITLNDAIVVKICAKAIPKYFALSMHHSFVYAAVLVSMYQKLTTPNLFFNLMLETIFEILFAKFLSKV